jgi:hypothetical protein
MMNVFLDDLRPVPNGFILAKTVEEAYELIYRNRVKILSLDHDLGGLDGSYKKTGYDLCKLLVEMWNVYRENEKLHEELLFPSDIYLHTANPVGRMNMHQLLTRYKPDHVKVHNSPIPNWMIDDY